MCGPQSQTLLACGSHWCHHVVEGPQDWQQFNAGSTIQLCLHACRMRPEEYAPSYDFRGLSTVEELQWAVGPDYGDVTDGKDVELNIFSRQRLEEVEVGLSLVLLPLLVSGMSGNQHCDRAAGRSARMIVQLTYVSHHAGGRVICEGCGGLGAAPDQRDRPNLAHVLAALRRR